MGIIPGAMADARLRNMDDADFERLVVAPGERFCAEMLRIARDWKAENDAFLAERHPGMTIEAARRRWTTDAERDAVQAEYRAWKAGRGDVMLAKAA